ncbi:MAG: type II toxin-antitoxin system VapC family toxin [Deltaproteobacteria bacterium]|nr:type II toxin-antitoxin system VapC family toxin [Deltaproteobacteria bacterium]
MITLDTHAWIWWASSPDKLSRSARKACSDADTLVVPAISAWEVAMLVSRGRLGLDRDVEEWIRLALVLPKVRLAPLTPVIAVLSTRLPGALHGDPADRMIAATALANGARLVTKDERLAAYPHVHTVW